MRKGGEPICDRVQVRRDSTTGASIDLQRSDLIEHPYRFPRMVCNDREIFDATDLMGQANFLYFFFPFSLFVSPAIAGNPAE